MFMIVKKKQITVISIIIFLSIAALLSYKSASIETTTVVSGNPENESQVPSGEAVLVSSDSILTNAKNNRETVRSKACELLNNTIKDSNISADGKTQAESQLLAMAKDMDTELECESMLSAKGFGECVVFVSDSSVNVTVSKKGITKEDVAIINDIIFSLTGNNNIKIVEVE